MVIFKKIFILADIQECVRVECCVMFLSVCSRRLVQPEWTIYRIRGVLYFFMVEAVRILSLGSFLFGEA